MNILLIGAGLVGQERLSALSKISIEHSIKFDIRVVDTNDNVLDDIEKRFNVKTNNNLNDELVRNPDWIFICVPHSAAADITINSFNYSKNIVVEKPLGRNLEECDRILEAKPDHVDLHVGLNYRFYLGINLLLNHVRKNLFGDLISVNMVLGHGNSPGMENSWKLDPIECGGGCLIDPGVHLLDIVLLLSKGELKVTGGTSWEGFWDTGIEEEVHLVLQDSSNVIFNVQTSLNRWKSHFRVEVNGTKGYGRVSGRGRSYGHQSYITGRRWGWQSGKSQGESEVRHIDNHVADDSFYECMLALFSLSSWKIQDSEIYPCDHTAGRKIMSLLTKCRNELQITDTV